MPSKVSNEFNSLFSLRHDSPFSSPEFRDMYETHFGLGQCRDRAELRKWLHRRLLTCTKNGVLERVVVDGKPKFSVVDTTAVSPANVDQPYEQQNTSKRPTNARSKLEKVLSEYQVDIISSSSECEEYKRLISDFPHLGDQIEPIIRAKSRYASELIGKARAVSELLKLDRL